MGANKQRAGDNSTQIQIGTVNSGLGYSDVKEICTDILRTEMERYASKAFDEAERRFNVFTDNMLQRLSEIDGKLLNRFEEPAVQMSFHEATKSYIRSGDEFTKENLIDLLIERLRGAETSTTLSAVIDEAIQIVPKLTESTLSLLALIVFSQLNFPCDRKNFEQMLLKMTETVVKASESTPLDSAYLQQIGCCMGFKGLLSRQSIKTLLFSSYDLFYKKSITLNMFNSVTQSHEIGDTHDFMFLISLFDHPESDMMFRYISSRQVENALQEIGKMHLKPVFDNLVSCAATMSQEEKEAYVYGLVPEWKDSLAKLDNPHVNSLNLNPVGCYLGIRKLSSILDYEIPLNLFYQ